MNLSELFIEFEMHYSYYYLMIFLIGSLFLIFTKRKLICSAFRQPKINYFICAALLIISYFTVAHYSPHTDHRGSMSENYKLSAAYYATDHKYMLCLHETNDHCVQEIYPRKAPGYSFLLSLPYLMFGASSALVFNLALAVVIPCVLFWIIYKITASSLFSALLSLIYIFSNTVLYYSTQTDSITISHFFLVISLLFLVLSQKNKALAPIALFSFIWLAFIRAEFIILLVISLFTLPLKNISKRAGLFFAIFFILILLHAVCEKSFHTNYQTGEYLSVKHVAERLINRPYDNMFYNPILLLLFLISLFRLKKWNIVPTAHVILFSFFYLSYQGGNESRYLSLLIPSYLITISGSMVKRRLPMIMAFLLILCCAIELSALEPQRIIENDLSYFDQALSELPANSTVIFINDVLTSRAMLETDNEVISLWWLDKYLFEKSLMSTQDRIFFILSKDYDDIYHKETYDWLKDNYNLSFLKEHHYVGLYELTTAESITT